MKNFLERLNDEVLVCDGAMGTMLMKEGMPKGVCPEMWGIENAKILTQIHNAYIDSGSDIITTNTFGANAIKLKKFNLADKSCQINQEAAELAKDVAGDKAYVFGDMGPTGGYLKPVGDIEPDYLLSIYAEQAKALEKGGVDAIILETFSDMEELKRAIMAVKENTKLPLIASMTFNKLESKGFRTTSGISIPQFVDNSLSSGCDVIGANCTLTAADIVDVVSEVRALGTAFIIVQSNAGMPKLDGEKVIYDESPETFKEEIPRLAAAGANIIGGCCGTTPEHISKIREFVDNR